MFILHSVQGQSRTVWLEAGVSEITIAGRECQGRSLYLALFLTSYHRTHQTHMAAETSGPEQPLNLPSGDRFGE